MLKILYSFQMKKIRRFQNLINLSLFLPLFLNLSCNFADVRIQNPKDLTEAKNQTLVGFVIVDDLNDDAQDASAMILKVYPIYSKGMFLFDAQTNSPIESLSNEKKPIVTVEEEGEKVSYTNQFDSSTPTYLLDSRKEHYLGYLYWDRFCNYCSNPPRYKINFNPQKSISTLKIKGKPGEIVFLGFYKISVIRENFDIKDFISNKTKNLDYKFERISANSPFWEKDFKDYSIWSKFDRDHGFNERSAEIKFLKDIIANQKKGYWKEKAEQRLTELLAKK
ncbi:hypothetical protein EHQ19_15995 [Leptospira montravelensis]|nr:hypothetical protein [Leptospira montravelensis]TGK81117.1 hypothetical protein EHQ19_15995 [Leptospira montravelensis]